MDMDKQKVKRCVDQFSNYIEFEDIKIGYRLIFPDHHPHAVFIAVSEPKEDSIEVLTEETYYKSREKMWMEYCDFLSDKYGGLDVFANVHGMKASQEDIDRGYELRKKLGFTEHPFMSKDND